MTFFGILWRFLAYYDFFDILYCDFYMTYYDFFDIPYYNFSTTFYDILYCDILMTNDGFCVHHQEETLFAWIRSWSGGGRRTAASAHASSWCSTVKTHWGGWRRCRRWRVCMWRCRERRSLEWRTSSSRTPRSSETSPLSGWSITATQTTTSSGLREAERFPLPTASPNTGATTRCTCRREVMSPTTGVCTSLGWPTRWSSWRCLAAAWTCCGSAASACDVLRESNSTGFHRPYWTLAKASNWSDHRNMNKGWFYFQNLFHGPWK